MRTLDSILRDLKDFARLYYPEFDTGEGALLNDLLFRIHAFAGELFYSELQRVLNQIRWDELKGDILEEEARKYGLVRRFGTKAKGKVIFYTKVTPPSTGISIPARTVVYTRAGFPTFEFETLHDATIYPMDYKIDTGQYEVEVEVQALNPGRDYNVGMGMIRFIQNPIAGIEGVLNRKDLTGGTDEEDDEGLKERLLKRILGRNFGSKMTFEELVESKFNVADAKILEIGEGYNRSTGPDMVVIFEETFSTSETFIYQSAVNPERRFKPKNQPIQSVVEVRINGVPTTDFVLEKDIDFTRDSIFAKDTIRITTVLNDGDAVGVFYKYFGIGLIQEFIDNEEYKVPSIALWIRAGRRYNVKLNLKVSFLKGKNVALEQDKIREALSIFLSTYDLGEPLDKSDIISTVQKGYADIVIDSVDFVLIDTWEAKDDYGNILVEVNGSFVVPFDGYVRLGDIFFIL